MEERRKAAEQQKPKANFTCKIAQQSPSLNKRKLAYVDFCNSSRFKFRALLRQLRPQFIQVLQAPDFRNCKAAYELQIQLKHLKNLYEKMIREMGSFEKPVPKRQLLSGVKLPRRQFNDTLKDGNVPEFLQPKQQFQQSTENKVSASIDSQMKLVESDARKSYIVGGSAFSWNFITYRSSDPVYYGVKKESYINSLKSQMSGAGL